MLYIALRQNTRDNLASGCITVGDAGIMDSDTVKLAITVKLFGQLMQWTSKFTRARGLRAFSGIAWGPRNVVFDNHNQAVGLLFSGGEATPISYFTHWRDLAKHIVLVTRHELFLLNTFHASRMCLRITEFYFHPYLISMPDPHENDPGCCTLGSHETF
ncbi:uncharacterized protein ASPGLDRAFT_25992 [Aspergillus glaucus CBS 516.65]|uniref:Uncharacterized protein n=1 Tax=Aspergillus glaucus CBS 516.65 TaxID=1160497 RepID=A0A1L9VIS0_ASPGL|nr:hypothetical protein ASPGLDRAFT_25992 [Aspergillus glaucus CBS 516.65]OJJ83794.1 hypothetical protein ASPGLDRAFT_25992 [Aspergillus glaucus CBS 516.65]